MKQSMLMVAAVISAGIAVADVTSANVVGYMNENVDKGKRVVMTFPFEKVDGTGLKIKDFKPVSLAAKPVKFSNSNFYIIIWGDGGNPLKIGSDTWIQEKYGAAVSDWNTSDVRLYYSPDDDKWFLTYDNRNKTCDMSDYPIRKGQGYSLYSNMTGGSALVTAGGVIAKSPTITIEKGKRIVSGNIAPQDMKISDLTMLSKAEKPVKFSNSNFYVIIWGDGGNPLKIGSDTWIQEKYGSAVKDWNTSDVRLYYSPDDDKWFLTYDNRNKTCDMTDYPLKAGQGFTLYSNMNGGTDVDLPVAKLSAE